MDNFLWMENEQNTFLWTFSSFCFHSIRSHVMVFVVQNSVSNKSYGCVDSIHAKEIVKNSYFECFPAILYLSFIRYHPVHTEFSKNARGRNYFLPYIFYFLLFNIKSLRLLHVWVGIWCPLISDPVLIPLRI